MTAANSTIPTGSLPRKSTPGSPWTDQETSHLIDAYENLWFSLNRGQLKAHQWAHVAAHVPSKTPTQCRHKIEKLRKRYRSDLLRPARSPWPFFDRIDRMERGPVLPVESDPEEIWVHNTRSIDGILKGDFRGNLGKRKKEEEDVEMAAELRRFGEDYVKMERRRMDFVREIEREWMEMEAKRMEMILEAQRGFMETIARALNG